MVPGCDGWPRGRLWQYDDGVKATVGVIALVLVVWSTPALAQKRPVQISSVPDGAEVFLGDKESGPVGTTPLDLELEPGEYTMIFELPGHVPVFETLIVDAIKDRRKARRPVTMKVALAPAISTLRVKGDTPAGARVLVDGKDRGKLPLTIEVDPGAHQVQVIVEGREPYEEWIELEGGQEHEVTVSLATMAVVERVKPKRPRGPRGPLAIARAGTEFTWRRFRYQGAPDDVNTLAFDADGRLMATFQVEAAPWRLAPAAWRAWPLTMIVGFGITQQDTATRGSESANFNHRTFEAGLRYRWQVRDKVGLAFDLGWSRLLYTFAGELAYALPDVDYNMLRIGVRVEGKVGPALLWLGGENRPVAGGGDLDERFKAADADAFALVAGGLARFADDHVEVGLSYDLVRVGWSFEPEDVPMPMYQATGGTDLFHAVRLWVGGAY